MYVLSKSPKQSHSKVNIDNTKVLTPNLQVQLYNRHNWTNILDDQSMPITRQYMQLKGDMIFHIFTCICNCITRLDVMYTNAFELFLAWFIDFYISTCTKSLLLGRLAHMCCMFFDYVVLWHVAKLEFSSGVHKLWRVQTEKPSMKGVSKQYFP